MLGPPWTLAMPMSTKCIRIYHCLKTIFSSTHALAFRTGLLFDDLRDNLAKLHKDDFLNLGNLTIL
jgi:hypothetical protein